MIQIQKLNYAIGERRLLDNVDWFVHTGSRFGLIGPNGAGKTTLLRILSAQLQADSGEIQKPRVYTIGYLPQESVTLSGLDILATTLEGLPQIGALETRIHNIQHRLQTNPNDQDLLNSLGQLEHEFDSLGGYRIEDEAKIILGGLGFRQEDFSRSLAEFSGGWRMRVYLARLLIQHPDLLLLDEPSNHLDLPSLEWLEQYLTKFKGSLIIVSHDRYFLDRLIDSVAELEFGKLTVYTGKYHDYERQKATRQELLLKQYDEQQAELSQKQEFIERFRYKATKAKQVQSQIKKLDKVERIELPTASVQSIRFHIPLERESYKEVLKIKDMSFKYESDWVLQGISFDLYRGQKIALVGLNGAGKTTLTRLINQEFFPQEGLVTLGKRVEIGYYAQHQIDALPLEKTVYDAVADTAATSQRQKLRDVLGTFGFSGDTVEKQIGILSGGEKARVSLAKILLSPVNFLIMDEPTNHLDIRSKEALELALADYQGTLLLIAHDRYFLDKLVSRVVEIQDRSIRVYEGNYSDYTTKRAERATASRSTPQRASTELQASGAGGRKNKEQKRLEAEARQAVSKERNRIENDIEILESDIEKAEAEKSELETRLGDPTNYNQAELAKDLQIRYKNTNRKLADLYAGWETAQARLEVLLEQLG